jgi:ParB-like chromosome segregation protein Spo0J
MGNVEEIAVQYLPIEALTPADYNPRIDLQDGDKEFEKLKKSIKKFGFIDPIIYNNRTGRIIGGHQRWKAAKSLGLEKVPVVEVDLPEEQEKVLNIGLNKIGGEFDEEKLGMLLADIESLGDELELTGFDDFEIDALITAVEINNENTMGDLEDFLNDDDGEEYDDEDDEELDSDQDGGLEVPDGFVKYQIACTVEEREAIVKAVKAAKESVGVETSNEAMAYIANYFLQNGVEE